MILVLLLLFSVSSALAANATCPPWYYHRHGPEYCECGSNLHCRGQGLVEIEEGNCATSAANKDYYYIGMCLFMHRVNRTNRLFSEMPDDPEVLDDVMCGHYNRKGLLCGECYDGFGPAVYSIDLRCANCSHLSTTFAVFSYLSLELVPVTLFFIFVVLFRFNITSGPLLGYIIFCQMLVFVAEGNIVTFDISSNVSLSFQVLFTISLTLCRFWTMHWFFKGVVPPFCLTQNLTGVQVQLLRFVPVMFSVVLIALSLIAVELHSRNNKFRKLCKPLCIIFPTRSRTAFNSDAIFHAFASIIFLSHSSVFLVVTSLMVNIPAYNYNGSLYKQTVALDPTIEWLSKEHVKYIVVAAVPLTFLTLTPSVLLLVYPTRIYRCLSQYINARKRLAITAFVEALHSCFKDGLNGTIDYRALAGLIPFLIIPYACVVVILHAFGYGQSLAAVFFLAVLSFIVLCFRPCKSTISNISLAFHFLISAFLGVVAHLWEGDIDFDTEKLESTIVIIPVFAHFLVFIWAGYHGVKLLMTYVNGRFEWRVALSNGARKWFCHRKYHGYQELC